jgi:DNA-binding winged helix-turn-helix (wHTH) protein
MSGTVRHFYDFGQFRLDADKHRLLRDGQVMPLSSKAIEALLVLVQNPGKPLEREELMKAVWADTFVEDANLTVAISHLRKALGQNGENSEYIETVPRVGYRFVADVRAVTEERAPLICREADTLANGNRRRIRRRWTAGAGKRGQDTSTAGTLAGIGLHKPTRDRLTGYSHRGGARGRRASLR